MKLTTKQINDLINQKDKGVTKVCKEFNIAKNTFYWHTNPSFREKERAYQRERYNKLTKQQKKEILNKRRSYQKNYHKNRYNTDEEFKKKHLERVKKK